MMKKVIHNEISAPTGAWKCYFPASGYREFTLPIIYFLFDCHKVPRPANTLHVQSYYGNKIWQI